MPILRSTILVLLLSLAWLSPAAANPLLLVDRDNLEVLYAEDAGQPWHPASLTKLMTAYVAFEELAKGTVTLQTPVKLSRNAINQPPSKSGLAADTTISLEDALYILIVKSANDVAVAIAETVGGNEAQFVGMMNNVAQRMGLSATRFTNPHGLHDAAQVTSARDLAVLSLYIEQSFPQFMPIFSTGVVRVGNQRLESQNALLAGFAGTTGMKTGYVCASGLNLVATADRNGRRLLAVVLGGSSGRERNERAAELFLKGFSGSARGSGQSLLSLANQVGSTPVNMRPMICGKDAATYVKAQEAAFPMGLKDQPSYLNDQIAVREHLAVDLGRIRTGIALPRPRPQHEPMFSAAQDVAQAGLAASVPTNGSSAGAIPYPRPRPVFRQ